MSIALIAADAPGTGPRTRIIPPVADSLSAWAWVGRNDADSRQNRAARALTPARAVGSPTYDSAEGNFSGSNYLVLDNVAETANQTLFVVARCMGDLTVTGNRPSLTGWGTSTALPGTALFLASGPQIHAGFTTKPGGGSSTFRQASINGYGATDFQTWRLFAWTLQSGVGGVLYDLTKGVNSGATGTFTDPVVLNAANGLQVGGGFQSTLGAVNVACAVAHSRVLSKTEIDLQATLIAKYLNDIQGITGLIPGS